MLNRCVPYTDATSVEQERCAYPSCTAEEAVGLGAVCADAPAPAGGASSTVSSGGEWEMTSGAQRAACIVKVSQLQGEANPEPNPNPDPNPNPNPGPKPGPNPAPNPNPNPNPNPDLHQVTKLQGAVYKMQTDDEISGASDTLLRYIAQVVATTTYYRASSSQ